MERISDQHACYICTGFPALGPRVGETKTRNCSQCHFLCVVLGHEVVLGLNILFCYHLSSGAASSGYNPYP